MIQSNCNGIMLYWVCKDLFNDVSLETGFQQTYVGKLVLCELTTLI
jgi:hypothetical protein